MPRVTNSPASRKRRKKVLNYAKGYFGNKSKLFRYAKEAVQHAWQYAYIDRKKKKANMRGLWIVRLNAACREAGISYSRFIEGLKAARIELDRRALSEIAIADATAFKALVAKAKAALQGKPGVTLPKA
jgi:large subunit ribosomal protein L20